jgi:hypothetical protein
MGLYFLPAVYDQLAHDESEIGFDTKKPLVRQRAVMEVTFRRRTTLCAEQQ